MGMGPFIGARMHVCATLSLPSVPQDTAAWPPRPGRKRMLLVRAPWGLYTLRSCTFSQSHMAICSQTSLKAGVQGPG